MHPISENIQVAASTDNMLVISNYICNSFIIRFFF